MISRNSSVRNMLKEAQYWLDKKYQNDKKREELNAKLDILHNTTDIDRPLALNYPDNKKEKLHQRKTKCTKTLEKPQHCMDKIPPDDTKREELRTEYDVLHNEMAQMKLYDMMNIMKKTVEPFAFPAIESHNKEVPCASDAVALKYNKRYGRHLVATRNIRPEEVIAVEKPYSLILAEENIQTHCSNCLNVCWATIPCNYCTYAMYCSEECRNIEWRKYHDIECAVFSALIEHNLTVYDLFSIRLAVLALREAGGIKELRIMLKEVNERDDPRTKGFSPDGILHSDRYVGIYTLLTNIEKRTVPELLAISTISSYMLYFLATRTVLLGAKLAPDLIALAKNNDVTFFGSLILRHLQILPINTHNFDEMRKGYHVKRGTAPFCSLISHSCNPNICRQSRPNHIVICALQPIRKGEQLLDAYTMHFAMKPKAARQQFLLEQYYFKCDCISCWEDWPVYEKLKSFETLVKKSEDKAKIAKILKNLDPWIEGKVQAKLADYVKGYFEVVQVLHDCVPMANKDMIDITEVLKLVYNWNGNVNKMPQIRKK